MENSVLDYCFILLFAAQYNRIKSQSELKSEMQRYLFGIKKEYASFGDCRNDTIIKQRNNIMTEMYNRVWWILYLIVLWFIAIVQTMDFYY